MPDDLPDDLEEDDPSDSNVVKALRRQAREAKAQVKELQGQAARATAAERELAFARAGVPLDDPKFKYFVKGFDGELSSDVIRAEAAAAGLLQADPAVSAATTNDIAAMNRISQASAGAPSEDSSEHQRYLDELNALRDNGVRDPYVLQKQAEAVMRKYGSAIRGQ